MFGEHQIVFTSTVRSSQPSLRDRDDIPSRRGRVYGAVSSQSGDLPACVECRQENGKDENRDCNWKAFGVFLPIFSSLTIDSTLSLSLGSSLWPSFFLVSRSSSLIFQSRQPAAWRRPDDHTAFHRSMIRPSRIQVSRFCTTRSIHALVLAGQHHEL